MATCFENYLSELQAKQKTLFNISQTLWKTLVLVLFLPSLKTSSWVSVFIFICIDLFIFIFFIFNDFFLIFIFSTGALDHTSCILLQLSLLSLLIPWDPQPECTIHVVIVLSKIVSAEMSTDVIGS